MVVAAKIIVSVRAGVERVIGAEQETDRGTTTADVEDGSVADRTREAAEDTAIIGTDIGTDTAVAA